MNLDFVCTGPSPLHRCRAFFFASAGLFLLNKLMRHMRKVNSDFNSPGQVSHLDGVKAGFVWWQVTL